MESPARPPIVDHAVLAELRAELDAGIYHGFITDYIGLLPRRLTRLEQAVQSMDGDAATDAIISLKTSSLMVGAVRLAALAVDFESRLNIFGTGPGTIPYSSAFMVQLAGIRDCIDETAAGLTGTARKAAM